MAHDMTKTQTAAREPRADVEDIANLDEWTQPEVGELLPPFRLSSTDGRSVSPWDYKERQSLLLFFFDPRESADLEALAELRRRYPEITDANAEVLAIGTHSMADIKECAVKRHYPATEDLARRATGSDAPVTDDLQTCAAALDMPFPILADDTGEVARDYCVTEAAMYVADQYGELECHERVSAGLDRVLESCINQLGLISVRCPECGI